MRTQDIVEYERQKSSGRTFKGIWEIPWLGSCRGLTGGGETEDGEGEKDLHKKRTALRGKSVW